LFKIYECVLKDSVLAIIFTLLLFTSPVLVYYANNFLMDVPAFSLVLVSMYFFFRFIQSENDKYFYWFVFINVIAGLLKISSLMIFIAVFGLFVLEMFNIKIDSERKIFQKPLKQFALLISVLVIQLILYMYASNYNSIYNGGIFLVGYLPIWDLDFVQIKVTFDAIIEHIKHDYFRRETQIVFGILFILVLAFYKHINKIVLYIIILLSIGFLLFGTLFFQALKDHDYYTINLFILIPVIFLGFLQLLKNKLYRVYSSIYFRVILIIFLIYNIKFAKDQLVNRYSSVGWQNENYIVNIQPFEDINTYLQSLGIKNDDKVISLSDNSINISLYFMNKKGWTNYGINLDSLKIEKAVSLGAKYLFIYGKEVYKEPGIQPFIKNKIGEFKNIDIYSL